MTTVNILEVKSQLSPLLRRDASGEEVVIAVLRIERGGGKVRLTGVLAAR